MSNSRSYYLQNRDKILAQRAQYYGENKQMINERAKKYYKKYYEREKEVIIKRAVEQNKKWSKEDPISYKRAQQKYQETYKAKKLNENIRAYRMAQNKNSQRYRENKKVEIAKVKTTLQLTNLKELDLNLGEFVIEFSELYFLSFGGIQKFK